MKTLYLLLCILGTLLPLSQFIPWLAEHGPNVPLLVQHIAADRLSAFAWLDVLVSAAALTAFVVYESRRLKMRYGWVSLLGLCVGVSLALPLFLLMRECRKQNQRT